MRWVSTPLGALAGAIVQGHNGGIDGYSPADEITKLADARQQQDHRR
jgi:hypothetical protein